MQCVDDCVHVGCYLVPCLRNKPVNPKTSRVIGGNIGAIYHVSIPTINIVYLHGFTLSKCREIVGVDPCALLKNPHSDVYTPCDQLAVIFDRIGRPGCSAVVNP